MPTHQLSLTLIPHKVQDSIVEQRSTDGYINATAMCQAAGRRIAKYLENDGTQAFLDALATDVRIRTSELVQIIKGGAGEQGTWVHPQVAIHLAQWLSPEFAVTVTKWVFDWMSGKGQPTKLPYHLERHMLNLSKIPPGYFSALQEMTNFLVGPMEVRGYRLPDHLMPDISQAKMLCAMLRERHKIDTKSLSKYRHTFPDGREVEANLYPNEYLAEFRDLMDKVWMPEKAAHYFKSRDPAALPVLDQMLALGHSPTPRKIAANKATLKKKA